MTRVAELKTVLLTDLVDSTKFVEEVGDERAAEILRRHDEIARALLREHQGREIDKTDGFLMLFDRPISAVGFATKYHEALKDLSDTESVPLTARVGIHLGEVYTRENSPDDVARGAKPLEVEGLAKPMAARLMSLANARQTLLSRAAYDVAKRGSVGAGGGESVLRWRSHYAYQFKGVAEPVEVFEVGIEGTAPLTAPRDSEKARRVSGVIRPSILVLPFEDLSAEADTDYISHGLADEIIASLSSLEGVRVISRTAAMHLKGTDKDVRTLGAELNVQYVLSGGLRKAGDKLRITAQLARTDQNELLWANKWAGTLDAIFEIEETISRNVVSALEVQLSAQEKEKLAERPIPNLEAFEYYLRARQQIYSFTADGLRGALAYLKRGEEIIGDNAQITFAMGYVYWQFVNAGIDPNPEYLAASRKCAEKLLQFDPDSSDGHRLLGLVGMHEKGDIQTTVRHLKASLDAKPNDTDTLLWLPLLYGFAGRPSSGAPLAERLLGIDPLTTLHHVLPGFLRMLEGDYERGAEQLAECHKLNPGNPITTSAYAQVLAMAGRSEEACEIFAQMEKDVPDSFFAQLGRLYIHALKGEKVEARSAVTTKLEEAASSDLQYSWSMAQCHSLLGNTETAIKWMNNAVKFGFWNYPLFAERDPLLAAIRGEKDFQSLMVDVKRRWMDFEV